MHERVQLQLRTRRMTIWHVEGDDPNEPGHTDGTESKYDPKDTTVSDADIIFEFNKDEEWRDLTRRGSRPSGSS